MDYSYKIYDSVSKINRTDWENVVAASSYPFLSYGFIQAVAHAMGDKNKFWYVLFYYKNTPVACTVFSLFVVDMTTISSPWVKKIITTIRKLFPSFLNFKTLFCGIPVSVGQKPLLCTHNSHFEAIIPELEQLMDILSKKEKPILNIFKEISKEENKFYDVLKDENYLGVKSLPMHSFGYHFKDFSAYLEAIKSRYRNSIKRAQKKFEKSTFKIFQTHDTQVILDLYTPEVHQLYLAVVEKSENKLEVLPHAFFIQLVKNFPNQVFFTFAQDHNSKVVGFNCSLFHSDVFYFIFCGMNYAINNNTNLYYNLIYNSLDQALVLNPKIVHVGQTTDDFKARLGCHTHDLYLYLKSNTAILNVLLRVFRQHLFPHKEVKKYGILKGYDDHNNAHVIAKQTVAQPNPVN